MSWPEIITYGAIAYSVVSLAAFLFMAKEVRNAPYAEVDERGDFVRWADEDKGR